MSELTCGACGRPVRAGARFCTGCGAPAAPMIVVEAQPPTRRSSARGGASGGRGSSGGRSRRTSRPDDRARAVAHAGAMPAASTAASTAASAASPATAPAAARPARVTSLGAAFDGVHAAGVGARLGAFAIDTLVVAALTAAVALVTRNVVLAALVAAELAIGLVVWEARTGRTFGNLALGLRASRTEAPYAPGLRRAVSRALVLLGGHVVAGVGQWVVVGSVAADRGPLRQGWHDKAGRAVVVDVRGPRAGESTRQAARGAAVPVGAPLQAAATTQAGAPAQAGGALQAAAPPPAGAPARSAPPVPVGAVATGAVPAQLGAGTQLGAGVQFGAGQFGAGVQGVPLPGAGYAGGPVPLPGSGTATPPPPPAARPRTYVLTLDTGEAMSVSGPGVIGRAPRPRDGERCDHVVAIDDPERSLSRTHARFGIDARGFWVADAGSGNGTVAVLPSGQSVVVEPERPTYVPSGSTIRVGDRTVLVEQLGA